MDLVAQDFKRSSGVKYLRLSAVEIATIVGAVAAIGSLIFAVGRAYGWF